MVIKNIIDRLRSAEESVITGMDIHPPAIVIDILSKRIATKKEREGIERLLGKRRKG